MRFVLAPSVLLFLASAHAGPSQAPDVKIFRPHRVALSDLVSDRASSSHESFFSALTQYGIVAVKNIPGYAEHKNRALLALHGCIGSSDVQHHTFPDGTVRRTLATRTVPGPGGAQKIFRDAITEGCEEFVRASDPVRAAVSEATQAFANRLGSIIDTGDDGTSPLLSTADGSYGFRTLGEVVENGEHLEHFHSYQRGTGSNEQSVRHQETIELHTDQGLFIAFTPGMITSNKDNDVSPTPSSSMGGFYIELKDGTLNKVNFEPDDLVFMLGDGVNQYINPHIEKTAGGATLRATPHALTMPNHAEGEVRVWHGRMVLPPSGAVHPKHGKTFGHLRKLMIEASVSSGAGADDHKGEDYLSIGCSSPSAAARLLDGDETATCKGNSIFCWHRCMSPTEFGVSEEVCADRGLSLKCMNPRDQIYVEGHGDYFPGCTNSQELATPYPKLPAENGYPRDEDACTEAKFEIFASSQHPISSVSRSSPGLGSTGYDHTFDLGTAKFMWSVKNGEVNARLAFNGLFGWLAFGLAGPEGSKKNGMHDASIIMALPGGDYSAVTGLDLSLDPTIEEYVIDSDNTAFRHWMTPIPNRDTSSYQVETTNCFTALTFTTDSIDGIKFNLEGKDELLWGANNEDYYAGYHGRDNRARFAIDWSTGKASLFGSDADIPEDTPEDGHEDDHEDGHEHTDSHSHTTSSATIHKMGMFVLSLVHVGTALAFGMA